MFAILHAIFVAFFAWLLDADGERDPWDQPTERELRADRARYVAELQSLNAIHGPEAFGDDAKARWNELNQRIDKIDARINQEQIRERRLRELHGAGSSEPGHPFADATSFALGGGSGGREAALRLIDREHGRSDEHALSDHAATSLSRLLRERDPDQSTARQLTAVGSPLYLRWFERVLRHGQMAGAYLSAEEMHAREAVAQVERAMAIGTGGAGGFLIPFALDPTIQLSSNGVVNPIRQIARIEQVTVNEWRAVTTGGGTAAYSAEAAEAVDNTSALVQPVVQADRARFFVPFSIELDQDDASIRRELVKVTTDRKDELEADKYLNGAGHGSNEPAGILASPAPGTTSGAATGAGLGTAIYAVLEALPPRFRPNASWLWALSSRNRAAQIETTAGSRLFTSLDVDRLLSKPVYELSTIPGGTASAQLEAIVGDFDKYVIVDRVGMSAEVIPHLFGTANNFPTGQRGFYAFWRNGGTVLIQNAFRQLKVT